MLKGAPTECIVLWMSYSSHELITGGLKDAIHACYEGIFYHASAELLPPVSMKKPSTSLNFAKAVPEAFVETAKVEVVADAVGEEEVRSATFDVEDTHDVVAVPPRD